MKFQYISHQIQVLAVIIICIASSSCLAFAPSNFNLKNYYSSKTFDVHVTIGATSLNTPLDGRPSTVQLFAHTKEQDQPNNDRESNQEKLESFQTDIQEKFEEDRSYNAFGILTPLAKSLDSFSGDWALSYADLHPATPRTIEGQAFLATNVCYTVAGIVLGIQGDWFFAALTELAGIVSFW